MLRLQTSTSNEWLCCVLDQFDHFLIDHASCERKASATALQLLLHYPDRKSLVREMTALAVEELNHFAQVMKIIDERGLTLVKDTKDAYVGQLRGLIRSGAHAFFMDRLLIAGIIEARGCERFGMLANALTDPALQLFYKEIAHAEARHHGLFIKLAKEYFESPEVDERLAELLKDEASIISVLPFRPALH